MGDARQYVDLEEAWRFIEEVALAPYEMSLVEHTKLADKREKLLSNSDYAKIYTLVYTYCNGANEHCEELLDRHEDELDRYIATRVQPALKSQSGTEQMLGAFVTEYNKYQRLNRWYQKIFSYLDRWCVGVDAPSLEQAGLQYFKMAVFDHFCNEVADIIVNDINAERSGKTIDRELVRAALRVFQTMGMNSLQTYILDFEVALLESTQLFYKQFADQWASNSVPEYLLQVELCIEKEQQLAQSCLIAEESGPKVQTVLLQQTLAARGEQMLQREDSGCMVLLQQERHSDLARMYRLLSLVPEHLNPMADILAAHILELGGDLVHSRQNRIAAAEEQSPAPNKSITAAAKKGALSATAATPKEVAEDPEFVRFVLELHDKYDGIIALHFGNNPLFLKALKKAFVGIMNFELEGKLQLTDLLCDFCDRLLKGNGVTSGGNEKLSEKEVEEYLEKCVNVFSYLNDKDVFADLYRTQLAKRLLQQRSASQEMELFMVGKLKLQCGAQYTSKLEGMLNDLTLGVEHAQSFQLYYSGKTENKGPISMLDFGVQLLTMGYWPSYKTHDVKLPRMMESATEVFKEFYDVKNPQRRLQWVHTLGTVTMKCTFGGKSYDVQLTPFQAAVLCAFTVSASEDPNAPNLSNEKGDCAVNSPMPFASLLGAVGMTEDTLKRVLHSLVCGKFRLLKKIAANPTDNSKAVIKTTDSYQVNESFSSPLRKFRIAMASIDECGSAKRVEEDRSIAIEAAVVRIMKARKSLSHQQLVAEVLAQLVFFRPDPKLVKRRIEALIDREYIERDSDNPSIYKYLA